MTPTPPPSSASSATRNAKLYRACQQCVRAKAKCHDVTRFGCLRCRIKRQDCSLEGHQRASGSGWSREGLSPVPPSHDESEVHDLRRRLEEVEERCRQLEDKWTSQSQGSLDPTPPGQATFVNRAPAGGSTSSISTGTIHTPLILNPDPTTITYPRRQVDWLAILKSIMRDPPSMTFDERLTCIVDTGDYPNPILRGLITQEQAEMAYMMAKHRLAPILPLPRFLDSASATPSHPFLLLAACTHCPSALTPAAFDMIDESVLYAMTGAAVPEVVLALFVLALAPTSPHGASNVPLTSLRLISLAFDMARDLGLDIAAQAAAQQLISGAEHVDQEPILLWQTLSTRWCLSRIQSARCDSATLSNRLKISDLTCMPSLLPRLPHLRILDGLVYCSRPMIDALAREEVRLSPEPDLSSVHAEWTIFERETGELQAYVRGMALPQRDRCILELEITATRFCLSVRSAALFTSLPPDTNPEVVEQTRYISASILLPACESFIDTFLSTTAPQVSHTGPGIGIQHSASSSHLHTPSRSYFHSHPYSHSQPLSTTHLEPQPHPHPHNPPHNQSTPTSPLPTVSSLPVHLITQFVACLTTARRAVVIASKMDSSAPPIFDPEQLARAEAAAQSIPGLSETVLRDMWFQLEGDP